MNTHDFLTKLEMRENVRIYYFKCLKCRQEFFKPNGLTCACPVCGDLCTTEKEFVIKTVRQEDNLIMPRKVDVGLKLNEKSKKNYDNVLIKRFPFNKHLDIRELPFNESDQE